MRVAPFFLFLLGGVACERARAPAAPPIAVSPLDEAEPAPAAAPPVPGLAAEPGVGFPGALIGKSTLTEVTKGVPKECGLASKEPHAPAWDQIRCFSGFDGPLGGPDTADLFTFNDGLLVSMSFMETRTAVSVRSIGIGATAAAVRATFGEPTFAVRTRKTCFGYPSLGVAFELGEDERVVGFDILAPFDFDMRKYSRSPQPLLGVDGLVPGTATKAQLEKHYGLTYGSRDEGGRLWPLFGKRAPSYWVQNAAPSFVRVESGRVAELGYVMNDVIELPLKLRFNMLTYEVRDLLGEPARVEPWGSVGRMMTYPDRGMRLYFGSIGLERVAFGRKGS